MSDFSQFNLNNQLHYAIDELGFEKPTPIQEQSFSKILSGKDMVGIAQTGTGKTYAYMLPIIRELKFSKQVNPRILILVPTRELVLQVVEDIEKLTTYINVRILGVYGGTNINTQKQEVAQGTDIIVATPGRLYDLALSNALKLKSIHKLVIDEVDVMLDLGFRYQLMNIFEILPERKQNIMFSATMTEDVEELIDSYFKNPEKVSIAVSGTRLENIEQSSYLVPNFYTKLNLLKHLVSDKESYQRVIVFVATKRMADRIFEGLEEEFPDQVCVIHSNKTQNYRIRSIEAFTAGEQRIMIATDVMARGIDIKEVSHVVNFDTPLFPENYMHRIGRTGRAESTGHSVLFSTDKELEFRGAIEELMNYEIPLLELPEEVKVEEQLIPEERPKEEERNNPHKRKNRYEPGAAFHEKKEKNQKENLGGSYRRKLKAKYKKPKTRGDKNYNKRNKKK